MSELALKLIYENRRQYEAGDPACKKLDLGCCGLREIPEEVFENVWLEELILSNKWRIRRGGGKEDYLNSSNRGDYNKIEFLPKKLLKLQNLFKLICSGHSESRDSWGISKLENLPHSLKVLNIGFNKIQKIENLPPELEYVDFQSNRIRKIENLNTSIKTLSLNSNSIKIIEDLPLSLIYLNVGYNYLGFIKDNLKLLEKLEFLVMQSCYLKEIPQLPDSLRYLNLGENEIKEIKNIPMNINELLLYGNKIIEIKEIPAATQKIELNNNLISRLEGLPRGLKDLQISFNKIRKIENLPNSLKVLDIRYNHIRVAENLPNNIEWLYLGYNEIHFIKKLPSKLKRLIINSNILNEINEIPKEIQILEADNNRIEKIPVLPHSINKLSLNHNNIKKIENLTNGLLKLHLSNNNITVVDNLPNSIIELDLHSNLISTVIELPPKLKVLDLGYNKLTDIKNIPSKLIILGLCHNLINRIDNLPNSLQKIDLRNNRIKDVMSIIPFIRKKKIIPVWKESTNNFELNLKDNPIERPPAEILLKGLESIENWERELEYGKDYLYEGKLLIVGDPGAGKTTLWRKLVNSHAPLPDVSKTTKGIDIHQYNFELKDKPKDDFTVNVWDFGGQEVYHATHQFFLTKRSIYVLLSDAREEKTDFNYWLEMIEMLSAKSPIIIVQNEKGGRKTEFDLRGFTGRFGNILTPVFSLDLSRDFDKIDQLRDFINLHIQQLDHVGQELPKTWVQVREELVKLEEHKPFISLQDFYAICAKHDMPEKKRALQLSGYLHDLGTFLHFQDDPVLKHTVILQNEWATNAVYAIMDDDRIKYENKGHFTISDIQRILNHDSYFDMHDVVLQLMMNFELCYRVPDSNPAEYVAPQLLSKQKAAYTWNTKQNLQFRFTYGVMPKGLISRFIVRLHRYIKNYDEMWRSGAIMCRDYARAEVIESYDRRNIHIRVDGQNKKELLSIISDELDMLNKSYPELSWDKKVPCNCSVCSQSDQPHYYSYKDLQRRQEKNRSTVECSLSYEEVQVAQLLDDVQVRNVEALKKADHKKREDKYWKIFISYSKENLKACETLVRRIETIEEQGKKVKAWYDHQLIASNHSDDSIREQIESCDLFLCLVTHDFLATKYIWEKEMPLAKKLKKPIVPLIFSHCDWQQAQYTEINQPVVLPTKGKHITSKDWENEDEAWTDVKDGIRNLINKIANRKTK